MSDLDLIKEDVERYYKEQNNKGYSMVDHARSSPLFSFETLLKFAAMYHATKRMEEPTSEEPALNIDLVSYSRLLKHLVTLENYLRGEHNHETNEIQKKEDYRLYKETESLIEIIKPYCS